MDKKFCDKCGIEITNLLQYELDIYDQKSEGIINVDLCETCKDKILKLLK